MSALIALMEWIAWTSTKNFDEIEQPIDGSSIPTFKAIDFIQTLNTQWTLSIRWQYKHKNTLFRCFSIYAPKQIKKGNNYIRKIT